MLGLPLTFHITGGEINGCCAVPELINSMPDTDVIVSDKGYDSEAIREHIKK